MQKITKILIYFIPTLIIFFILVVPVVSFAQWGGLVPCGTDIPGRTRACDFNAFIDLIVEATRFVLFYLAMPIAAVMFAYAGVILVISGGSSESKTKAKNIFFNAFIGLVLAAGAWLIIKTLLVILGYRHLSDFFS